jgi:anthraniloyl-CoA monooxygenase
VRAAWPADRPMSVRISAHDWVEGGITPDDAVAIARAFKAAGADMIDCSSGQVSAAQKPVYGRMYQTPFADRIRNEAGIPTIAVGAISEADHVNSIIAAGRADLCAVARPHLANPAWTLTEAAKIGYTPIAWPVQYLSGKPQLEAGVRTREGAGRAGLQHRGRDGDPQAAARRHGMTLSRFDYLAQLHRHPEGLRMNALSRFLMVTGGNVTG